MGIFLAEMLSYEYDEESHTHIFFTAFNHGGFCYAKYVY